MSQKSVVGVVFDRSYLDKIKMRPFFHSCITTTQRHLKWAEPSLLQAGAAVLGERSPCGRGPGHLEEDRLWSRWAARGPRSLH